MWRYLQVVSRIRSVVARPIGHIQRTDLTIVARRITVYHATSCVRPAGVGRVSWGFTIDSFDVASDPFRGTVAARRGEPFLVDDPRAVSQPRLEFPTPYAFTARRWVLRNSLLCVFEKAEERSSDTTFGWKLRTAVICELGTYLVGGRVQLFSEVDLLEKANFDRCRLSE